VAAGGVERNVKLLLGDGHFAAVWHLQEDAQRGYFLG